MGHKNKWWSKMIAIHGSEDKVREFMRDAQKKSRENYKGTGGFASNTKLAKQAGKKGAEKRWGNHVHKNNTNTETKDNTEG